MSYIFLLSISVFCCALLLLVTISYIHANSVGLTVLGSTGKNISTSPNASSTIKNMTSSANNASSVSETQNNVTTSAGNNGNIYRGGTISGSGGE